jgi:hypothetical protein
MQYFGRHNIQPSIFNSDQVLALRFNLLNTDFLKPKSQAQALPTQNAIGSMFNNARVQNGFKI